MFEQRTSIGSELFAFLGGGFVQIFGPNVSISVKTPEQYKYDNVMQGILIEIPYSKESTWKTCLQQFNRARLLKTR